MRVVWLDQTDGPGGQDSHDQGGRQDASIVAVELDLRQDIHQSDADKDSRVQAKSPAKHLWLRCTDSLAAEIAGDGSKRTKQGIAKVDGYSARCTRRSAKTAGKWRLGALHRGGVVLWSVPVVIMVVVPATVVVMIVSCLGFLNGQFMLVKMKPPHHQYRAEQTDHRGEGCHVEGLCRLSRVRHQVENRDPHHQPAQEAHQDRE
jgi:hypothetical protein